MTVIVERKNDCYKHPHWKEREETVILIVIENELIEFGFLRFEKVMKNEE